MIILLPLFLISINNERNKRMRPVENELILILTVVYGRTTKTYHKTNRSFFLLYTTYYYATFEKCKSFIDYLQV
jgi:hypothetical protein